MKQFKPILGASAPEDKSQIRFPVLASYKLDGIRAIFHPELGLVSRSLKPIKNKQLQEKFKFLIDYSKEHNIILDGEFYDHELTFQQITSLVMTEDFMSEKTIKNLKKKGFLEYQKDLYQFKWNGNSASIIGFNNPLKFHMFDCIYYNSEDIKFDNRYNDYLDLYLQITDSSNIIGVEQTLCEKPNELDALFNNALRSCYEGLIIRDPEGEYKFGRSTVKEQGLLKYKPFVTYDAKIIDVVERFKNTNKSFKNELGQSTKRNTVDAKEGTGIASAFVVEWEEPYGRNDFHKLKVTLTGTEWFRKDIWKHKDVLIGKMIEFKGMDVGSKNVPRHPVFLRFREDRE